METEVENKFGKTIFRFPVLHLGWEADGWGYVVERDGKRKIILSNHGNFYVASVKELELKIAEYTKVKFQTKKAITLVTKDGKLD
jgi:hypothetical protein